MSRRMTYSAMHDWLLRMSCRVFVTKRAGEGALLEGGAIRSVVIDVAPAVASSFFFLASAAKVLRCSEGRS